MKNGFFVPFSFGFSRCYAPFVYLSSFLLIIPFLDMKVNLILNAAGEDMFLTRFMSIICCFLYELLSGGFKVVSYVASLCCAFNLVHSRVRLLCLS